MPIEWVDEEDLSRTFRGIKWRALLEETKEYPGRWARIAVVDNNCQIGALRLKFPDWSLKSRRTDSGDGWHVYARFNGEVVES